MQIANKGVLGGALQLTSSNVDMTLGNFRCLLNQELSADSYLL